MCRFPGHTRRPPVRRRQDQATRPPPGIDAQPAGIIIAYPQFCDCSPSSRGSKWLSMTTPCPVPYLAGVVGEHHSASGFDIHAGGAVSRIRIGDRHTSGGDHLQPGCAGSQVELVQRDLAAAMYIDTANWKLVASFWYQAIGLIVTPVWCPAGIIHPDAVIPRSPPSTSKSEMVTAPVEVMQSAQEPVVLVSVKSVTVTVFPLPELLLITSPLPEEESVCKSVTDTVPLESIEIVSPLELVKFSDRG